MQYSIEKDNLKVTVESYGAEMVSVLYKGKERLWQNQTGNWAGHSPLLFPVCGHFGVTHNGKSYPITAHGFAKRTEFTLTDKTENSITLSMKASVETKKVYPFDFVFSVTYTVNGDEVSATYTVENPANEPLYFACGGHDSFALDGEVDGYALAFDKEEDLVHYYHDDGGYLSGEMHDFGKVKVFPLPKAFLQKGNTLIFKDLQSSKVTLQTLQGEKLATLTFDTCKNVLLWRANNSPFICIEPWTNLPDLAGVEDIEFSKKDGVLTVEPKSQTIVSRTIQYA